jgi:hypothetical protein
MCVETVSDHTRFHLQSAHDMVRFSAKFLEIPPPDSRHKALEEGHTFNNWPEQNTGSRHHHQPLIFADCDWKLGPSSGTYQMLRVGEERLLMNATCGSGLSARTHLMQQ